MVTIIQEKEILSIVNDIDVISAMEEGFIKYSNGLSVVPPVGELLFENPKAEVHIKYGYIKEEQFFCVKIGCGFYENRKIGISTSQGLMLLFSQETGETRAVLLDGGHLTNIRTAAAGALAAKYFAPKQVNAVGIIGTGIQGRLQLKYLQKVRTCKKVWVWDHDLENAERYKEELGSEYKIQIARNPSELAKHCNLIITTTPSEIALLQAKDILSGTHITAVGSDNANKQELSSEILQLADIVISDSIDQSKSRGEVYRARKNKTFDTDKILELGAAIQDKKLHRKNDKQISIVDLTGVAVQDIMIAQAVYNTYQNNKKQ